MMCLLEALHALTIESLLGPLLGPLSPCQDSQSLLGPSCSGKDAQIPYGYTHLVHRLAGLNTDRRSCVSLEQCPFSDH